MSLYVALGIAIGILIGSRQIPAIVDLPAPDWPAKRYARPSPSSSPQPWTSTPLPCDNT